MGIFFGTIGGEYGGKAPAFATYLLRAGIARLWPQRLGYKNRVFLDHEESADAHCEWQLLYEWRLRTVARTGKIADAFPGLADQTGSGSWVDRLVDHLTTPRSASEPPPPPTPPGMPPEAYDDMKINKLTVRQVANIIANEDRDVTPGTSSPEDFYQSKLWKAHAIINADQRYGDRRDNLVGTAPKEVTAQLENSQQYNQALDAARQAFQEQLLAKTRRAAGCGSITGPLIQRLLAFSIRRIRKGQQLG